MKIESKELQAKRLYLAFIAKSQLRNRVFDVKPV